MWQRARRGRREDGSARASRARADAPDERGVERRCWSSRPAHRRRCRSRRASGRRQFTPASKGGGGADERGWDFWCGWGAQLVKKGVARREMGHQRLLLSHCPGGCRLAFFRARLCPAAAGSRRPEARGDRTAGWLDSGCIRARRHRGQGSAARGSVRCAHPRRRSRSGLVGEGSVCAPLG